MCSLLAGMCAGRVFILKAVYIIIVVVHVLHVVLQCSTVVVPVVDREADGSGTMVTVRSISWSL